MSEMERETRRGGKKGKVGRRIKGAKKPQTRKPTSMHSLGGLLERQ